MIVDKFPFSKGEYTQQTKRELLSSSSRFLFLFHMGTRYFSFQSFVYAGELLDDMLLFWTAIKFGPSAMASSREKENTSLGFDLRSSVVITRQPDAFLQTDRQAAVAADEEKKRGSHAHSTDK